MKEAMRVAFELCKIFEGLSLTPYLCPAGVPSIGYGSTRYEDGTVVTLGDAPIDKTRAELLLIRHLESQCIPAALKASPILATNERALGAIADFIYNLGSGRYRASTLRRRINAAEEMRKWTRASGRVLPGLVRRREAEIAQWAC
jgi:lysozyme